MLGSDVSKKKFHAALLAGGRTHQREFPNTASGFAPLLGWLQRPGRDPVHACLEATGTYGAALAAFLHPAGHRVRVVNPRPVRAFAASELARNKTDPRDAALIARFCPAHPAVAGTPPPPEIAALEALVRRRDALEQMRQQEANRLEAARPAVRPSITEHLEFLVQQIAKTQPAIREHIDSHPTLRSRRDLRISIPGIAEKTAAPWLSEMEPRERFSQARQLAAFAGLHPRQWTSGSSVRGRSRRSPVGSPRWRQALYLPALVALRYHPLVRHLAERLAAHGKHRRVIVGAARRQLLHRAYGILQSGAPCKPTPSRRLLWTPQDGI